MQGEFVNKLGSAVFILSLMARSRAWCWTLNNPSDEDPALLELAADSYDYLCYAREVGEGGTPHLQGYVEFSEPKTLTAVKRVLGDRTHCEPRKGTQDQAIKYCQKENAIVEIGQRKQQPGKRNDIALVRDMIIGGAGMRDVVAETTSFQSLRYAERALVYLEPVRSWQPLIHWYWGPTGYGKSHRAHEEAGTADTWYAGATAQWFQGYDGHANIIIDNFTANFAPCQVLLRLLDKYPMQVETKGGSRQLLAVSWWITSILSPDHYYACDPQCRELMRRLRQYGVVEEFTTPWNGLEP